MLVGPALGNAVGDQFHHEVEIKVGGVEFALAEGIVAIIDELNFLAAGLQALTELGVSGDVVLDELVSGNVKHIVLDAQVGAGHVHLEARGVINQDDSGAKLFPQLGNHCH